MRNQTSGGDWLQQWHGQRLYETETHWYTGSGEAGLSVGALHILPLAVDERPPAELQGNAQQFTRCEMDRDGLFEQEGYTLQRVHQGMVMVLNETMGQEFAVIYNNPHPGTEHCPDKGRMVVVDLVTGVILASGPLSCM